MVPWIPQRLCSIVRLFRQDKKNKATVTDIDMEFYPQNGTLGNQWHRGIDAIAENKQNYHESRMRLIAFKELASYAIQSAPV